MHPFLILFSLWLMARLSLEVSLDSHTLSLVARISDASSAHIVTSSAALPTTCIYHGTHTIPQNHICPQKVAHEYFEKKPEGNAGSNWLIIDVVFNEQGKPILEGDLYQACPSTLGMNI